MSNENSLNRNVAGSNKSGNLGNLAVGALFGRSIRGRSGRAGGLTERSAEDWNNQDLLEQRQHERAKELSTHNTALGAVTREHTAQTEVGALKDIHSYFSTNGYDLGNIKHGGTNVTLKPQKKEAAKDDAGAANSGASTDSQGTSGVQKGQQFAEEPPAAKTPSKPRAPRGPNKLWDLDGNHTGYVGRNAPTIKPKTETPTEEAPAKPARASKKTTPAAKPAAKPAAVPAAAPAAAPAAVVKPTRAPRTPKAPTA